jgi:FAD/FMN-containing dehydrogenase
VKPHPHHSDPHLSRRGFLGAAAMLGAAAWTPAFQLPAGAAARATAAAALPVPPGFPASIPLYQQAYENWSREIHIEDVWTCAPGTPADVVTLANWAREHGYRLRAKGMSHNWSPILVPAGADVSRIVLVDTTRHLTATTIEPGGAPATVTVQAGASMDRLLIDLERAGLGFAAIPAPGNLTVGGALAIGAHGSAVPARGETRTPGTSYGTLSNLVLSLTAVVWDQGQGRYALRTFTRSEPDMRAFLVHLGRAFVTEVTLQVGADTRLRCQSWFDIPATTLFAPPAGARSRSFASLLDGAGRIEAIWFPFTEVPWVKVWSRAPRKPLLSREVSGPYNYTFANSINGEQSGYIEQIVAGNVSVTPAFENLEMAIVGSGLITTGTWDIWGWSKNTYLYVQPTTLRIIEAGHAVLCARAHVQRVVSEFFARYRDRVLAYQAQGRYPMNGPIEIRVTGLDVPGEVAGAAAVTPQLSAARPRPDHPEWDTVVWLDMGTIPGTPGSALFYREMEQWILANYTGSYACVRPEWSKAWAVSPAGAWTDTAMLTGTIPAAFRAGQPAGDNWDTARATLNRHDPHRVFGNGFLDTLLP